MTVHFLVEDWKIRPDLFDVQDDLVSRDTHTSNQYNLAAKNEEIPTFAMLPENGSDLLAADRADRDFLDFFLAWLHFTDRQSFEIEPAAKTAAFFWAETGGRFRCLAAIGTFQPFARQEGPAFRTYSLAISERHHCTMIHATHACAKMFIRRARGNWELKLGIGSIDSRRDREAMTRCAA
jgi:hypothetical protein